MGNTHSEAPIQRERDLPLQAVEVLRKDREDEKTSRKSNPCRKEEQQRVPASTVCTPVSVVEPQQARNTGVNPQLSVNSHHAPANAAILDMRVKPNQGKKRKIAKARKWASGQVASQDAVVVKDKLTCERLHSCVGTEEDRTHSSKAIDGLAMAAPALGFYNQEKEPALENQAQPGANTGNKDEHNQEASNTCMASKCTEQGTDTGTTSEQRGQGEPVEGTLHPRSPTSQNGVAGTAGKRVQLACTVQCPQGKPGPTKGQDTQAPINRKESPCKLIKLSIIRAPASPQSTSPVASDKAKLLAVQDNDQGGQGKGKPQPEKPPDTAPTKQADAGGKPSKWTAEEGALAPEAIEPGKGESPKREGQTASDCQADGGSTRGEAALPSIKRVLDQDMDLAPQVPAGRPKAHSFLNKWGAHTEKDLSPAGKSEPLVDLPPLPPGAKATAAHRAKHSASAAISYAEVLKQVPSLRISQDVKYPVKEAKAEAEVASLDINGTRELGDIAQIQDGASAAFKKKLPFYEQLIASLKSQTQKQKGAKPQRQVLTQEELSQPKPAKSDCTMEAPIALQVPPEPLLLPSSEAQTQARSPQPLQLPSPSSFQFEAHSQLVLPEQSARTKSDPKFMQWFQSQQRQQPIFQFQSKSGHRTNPQEQGEATSSVSFGSVCQTANYPQQPVAVSGTVPQLNTSVQLQSQSWLRQQIEAQCRLQLHPQTQPWSVPMGSPPSLYTQPQLNTQSVLGNPASDQLPIWPLLPSQTQAQANFSAITHLQCQQHPKPAVQAPLHLQISCNIQHQPVAVSQPQLPAQVKLELPQQPKQIQAQAQAQAQVASKVQHQPEPKGSSKPSAPTPVPPKMTAKPQKQDQFLPKASLQTSAKAKSQAQAKGKKAHASFLNQQALQRQEPVKVQAETEPAAEAKSPVQRPTGRWSAFQIDKTCTRKCHCRHREDQGTSHLPRNIATWTNSVKEPFCETPWVRTAVLAGSLVAGTKFCMDHFKANNVLN